MAKLDGVITLDMQDGEITKIAHYGVEYTKVAHDFKDAQTGDIFFRSGKGYYVVTIQKRDYFGIPHPVRFTNDAGSNDGYMRECNAHPVYRKLAQPAEELTSGDRVRVSGLSLFGSDADGEIGTFISVDSDGDHDVIFDGGRGFLYKRSQLTKVSDIRSTELTDGTRVKALRSGEFRSIKAGEIGRITKTSVDYGYADPYNIRVKSGIKIDYFRPQDLEAHVPVKVAPPKPTVGDIVVITGNTNYSRNKVGDIGKIVEADFNDEFAVSVDVPGNYCGRISNYTRPFEMRHATDAEKAEYKKAVEQAEVDAVFTKAGRKPNEYRKGDLVRYLGKSSKHGRLAEVEEDGSDSRVRINMDGISTEHPKELEIVCFAEDRADAVAKGGR